MKPVVFSRRVFFHDEAPKIGSGWRRVLVISVGPKWAKIKGYYSPRATRLKRSVWDQIVSRT